MAKLLTSMSLNFETGEYELNGVKGRDVFNGIEKLDLTLHADATDIEKPLAWTLELCAGTDKETYIGSPSKYWRESMIASGLIETEET